MQPLSKSRALAGLRVGFAIGHPSLIEALSLVKGCFNSYPMDWLALAGAEAAWRDTPYFEAMRERVDQFLRISIGTNEQCRRLVNVVRDVLPQCFVTSNTNV